MTAKKPAHTDYEDRSSSIATATAAFAERRTFWPCKCATRNKPVHHDSYMKLYSAIEETGKPLAFHSGFHWGDPSFLQLNQFISMHALSFVHYSLIHLTNWVINGLPERFRKLKLVWVESGLAWVPFVMQRLDQEFMMPVCEAPMLKRLPSEYIREMFSLLSRSKRAI